jgi:hypothetical protein
MRGWLYRLFRLGPNPYSFFSGTVISAAVNLLTSVVFPRALELEVVLPIVSALLFFSAGCFSIVLAWELEEINRVALVKRPEFLADSDEKRDVWTVIVDSRLTKLSVCLFSSVTCSVFAVALVTTPVLLLFQGSMPATQPCS